MNWTGYLLSNKQFIHIVCDIFTSLGTVGAVIVSLYFSYRSNNPKPKIKVTATASVYQNYNPDTNKYEDEQHYAYIGIFNLGIFPMEINCFLWRTGLFKKEYRYQSPSAFDRRMNPLDHPTINYGQDVSYYIPLDLFLEGAKDILQTSKYSFINWLKVKFYYVVVKSNVGICYQSRIHKSLQNEILKKLKNLSQ